MNAAELVKKAQGAFRAKRTLSYEWRISQLDALKRMLDEKGPEIERALWSDLRKGPFESQVSEIGVVTGEIEFTRKHLAKWMKPISVSTPVVNWPGTSEIRHDPFGVVLVIGAWNYPVNLLLAPLVGALAGGNVTILKPSELAPATSKVMAKWVPEYLDREAVMVFEGGVPETDELLSCKFDYIFFTGSGTVGKIVMKKAAENLTPVTLELGGKSPAIVMEDTAIATAARRIAWGKFMNAGQTCIAPDYVLVHASIEAEFVAKLKESIAQFYGADPKLSADYCRIVNEKNYLRLTKFLTDGELFCGGRNDASERYIEPTVLRLSSSDVPVMHEEIFGPILPVIKINGVQDAIEFVNERPKPLALYLFTRSQDHRERVLTETSAGGVCFNDVVMHMPSPYLPFGGVGASGMGHYHGKRSFDTFTHQKAVMKKTTWPDFAIRYAPYNDANMKWIKRLS